MEEHEISSLRPDPIRAFRSNSGADVVVSNMEALHTLFETLGATAVCLLLSELLDLALIPD